MPDKELEIRYQFLDEAQDYLDNLDNALLGLASGGVNVQAINSAMRSAHSIKGGAGMMGFQLLNQLSHRLEDSLKVLKIQKHAVDINAELEQQLLSAVDCLRQVAESDRQGTSVDPKWLETQALPVFDQLYDRLGEPQEEDAASILSPEDNQDIVPLLFQTEVEGCLERLENVLAGDRHCLYEETEILAQELGALGEMLQLSAFSQLCNTILETIQAQPEQVDAIAIAALAAWRQTQQLVLLGDYSGLPTAIAIDSAASVSLNAEASVEAGAEAGPEMGGAGTDDLSALVSDGGDVGGDVAEFDAAGFDAAAFSMAEFDAAVVDAAEFDAVEPVALESSPSEFSDLEPNTLESTAIESAAIEPAATESAAIEPAAIEPAATASDLMATEAAQSFMEAEGTDLVEAPELDEAAEQIDVEAIESISDQSWAEAIAQAERAEDAAAFEQWSTASDNGAATSADWPDTDAGEIEAQEADDYLGAETALDGAEYSDFDAAGYADSALLDDGDAGAPETDYGLTPATPTDAFSPALEGGDNGFDSTLMAVDNSGLINYRNEDAFKPSKPSEVSAPPQPRAAEMDDDITVRVPVRQLKQLNNIFGELTIERNGLDLYLKRLRELLTMLRTRVKILDQTNLNLRSAYDRVTTRTQLQQGTFAALPQSRAQNSRMQNSRAQNSRAQSLQAQNLQAQNSQQQRSTSLSDDLTEAFDVLELDQYSDMHLMSQVVMVTIVQIQEVTTDLELSMDDTDQTFRGLNKTAKQLQTKLTQLQMRPLSDILERFPRALRKMSLEHGKSAEFEVQGGNILIDRNILEALNEPLLHLLRNAFDHGIEDPDLRQASGKPAQGTIEIHAIHKNNRTLISIRDDGKGIDLEKIRARARQMGLDDMLLAAASDDELISLIFEPGFSTSSNVTELSGRGVGMDVVRDSIKQLQGEISVNTILNQGTTVTLSLPFTLSVTRVLLVESNDMLLAFPTDAIEEMASVAEEQILKAVGGEAIEWEEQVVQFIRLHQWLQFNCPRSLEHPNGVANLEESTVLMVGHNDHLVALQVGRCCGEQEVAIRYVEGNLPMPPGFSTCTILGDGKVVPMVNVSELLRWITNSERSRPAPAQPKPAQLPVEPSVSALPPTNDPAFFEAKSHKPAILIVDDSINVRRFLALTLEKAGYRVEQAKDGQDAVDKLSAGLPVQAVICDIEMPRLDGYGVLARVNSNPALAHLPIAMLTSRSGDKHRKLAMSLGASAYFSKPYNEQVLLQTLRQIVESAIVA